MSMRRSVATLLTMVVSSFCCIAGCNQSSQDVTVGPDAETPAPEAGKDEYNPHDVPITDEQKAQMQQATATFENAVAEIKKLRNETENETKDGIPANPYVAHQALDKADLVLQWLPQVARDSGVAKEHWEEINTTANDLRTLFEKLHENIDNQQDPDFASVAQGMDENISRLELVVQRPQAAGDEG